MYHNLLSLPSSPPGLQPTARRPVEPCTNRHLPSPPSYCVAHIMSSHPWHCHYTIMRLNYLNAAVIIPEPHPSPAPEAPRPNLRHTRLPTTGRVPVRACGHLLRDPPGRGWRVFCDRGSAAGEPGAYVITAACSPKSRRAPLLTYAPAPLHHRRHSSATAHASNPARPGAVCGATAPPPG